MRRVSLAFRWTSVRQKLLAEFEILAQLSATRNPIEAEVKQ